mmetsp:Transcript_27888/g.89832  ORF Transcript_27888/g.89832 Transcript_27888/m.89832 type:complete len:213 (-) Transcript_27888:161-799(-)
MVLSFLPSHSKHACMNALKCWLPHQSCPTPCATMVSQSIENMESMKARSRSRRRREQETLDCATHRRDTRQSAIAHSWIFKKCTANFNQHRAPDGAQDCDGETFDVHPSRRSLSPLCQADLLTRLQSRTDGPTFTIRVSEVVAERSLGIIPAAIDEAATKGAHKLRHHLWHRCLFLCTSSTGLPVVKLLHGGVKLLHGAANTDDCTDRGVDA